MPLSKAFNTDTQLVYGQQWFNSTTVWSAKPLHLFNTCGDSPLLQNLSDNTVFFIANDRLLFCADAGSAIHKIRQAADFRTVDSALSKHGTRTSLGLLAALVIPSQTHSSRFDSSIETIIRIYVSLIRGSLQDRRYTYKILLLSVEQPKVPLGLNE